jgi:ribosome recycling factor
MLMHGSVADEQKIIADGVQQVTDAMIERIDDIIDGKDEDLSKP